MAMRADARIDCQRPLALCWWCGSHPGTAQGLDGRDLKQASWMAELLDKEDTDAKLLRFSV